MVDIIIAARNAETTIGRAVASALAQPEVAQCIVVDDASSDTTARAAHAADDRSGRLMVLKLERNLGPSGARNVALDASQSPWVGILDADDFMLPGRIAALIKRSGNCDLIADDILIVPEGRESGVSEVFRHHSGDVQLRAPFALDLERFVRGNIPVPGRLRGELGFLKPLMRRSMLDRLGLRYDTTLRLGEDYALYVRALMAGARFHVAGPQGYVAVERPTSLSSRHSIHDLEAQMAFEARCLQAPTLNAGEKSAFRRRVAGLRRNADFRRTLEVRQERGLLAGTGAALMRAHSVPYMVRETLRGRLNGWKVRVASEGELQPRLLIGGDLTRVGL